MAPDSDGAWIPVASAPLMVQVLSSSSLALLASYTQLPGQDRHGAGGCSLATRDLHLRVNDLLKKIRFYLVTLMQELPEGSEIG